MEAYGCVESLCAGLLLDKWKIGNRKDILPLPLNEIRAQSQSQIEKKICLQKRLDVLGLPDSYLV